jgi:hypothetical protein
MQIYFILLRNILGDFDRELYEVGVVIDRTSP